MFVHLAIHYPRPEYVDDVLGSMRRVDKAAEGTPASFKWAPGATRTATALSAWPCGNQGKPSRRPRSGFSESSQATPGTSGASARSTSSTSPSPSGPGPCSAPAGRVHSHLGRETLRQNTQIGHKSVHFSPYVPSAAQQGLRLGCLRARGHKSLRSRGGVLGYWHVPVEGSIAQSAGPLCRPLPPRAVPGSQIGRKSHSRTRANRTLDRTIAPYVPDAAHPDGA